MLTDRILGYFSLLLLASFVVVSVGTITWTVLQPVHYRVAMFTNVKALRVEDQVFVHGSTVGEVAKVEWKNSRAFVTIVSKIPLQVHRDYSLTIVDIGVMGDRVLNLEYGSPETPLVPPQDTLTGIDAISTPDAVGLAYKMREVTTMFVEVSTLLLKGDPSHPSLVEQYRDILHFADTTTHQLNAIATQLDRFSRTKADSLYRLIDESAALTKTIANQTPGYVKTANDQLASLSKLLDDIESLLQKVSPLIKELDSPETKEVIRQLADLNKATDDLQKIIAEIQNNGIKLRVWPF